MKGYKQKESNLNKKVVNELNKIPKCLVYKRHAGPRRKGQADITGCINGIRIELEGKVGDNKPTRLQAHWLKKWKAYGAITGWFRSVDEALGIVKNGID
jgi:hypothetical protein